MASSPFSDSPLILSECHRRSIQAFGSQYSAGAHSPSTPAGMRVRLPSFGLYRDANAPLWGDSPVGLRTQTFVQEGIPPVGAPTLNSTSDRSPHSHAPSSTLLADKTRDETPTSAKATCTPKTSVPTLMTMPYLPCPHTGLLMDEAVHMSLMTEAERAVISPVAHGASSDVAFSEDDETLRLLAQSPEAQSYGRSASRSASFGRPHRDRSTLSAVNDSFSGRSAECEVVPFADSMDSLDSPHTPLRVALDDTPRTPVDCLIAPPGAQTPTLAAAGLGGARSYTATPQLRSVLETPQKSTRRPHSRVSTPLRFGDKVERLNMSLESQQQGPNTSVRSAVPLAGVLDISTWSAGEALAASTRDRDHLSPNRNPFSLFRGYQAPYFMASFDVRCLPSASAPTAGGGGAGSCHGSRANSNTSTTGRGRSGDDLHFQQHRRTVSSDADRGRRLCVFHTALRPPAALVLCQQTVQRAPRISRMCSPRPESVTCPSPPVMVTSVAAISTSRTSPSQPSRADPPTQPLEVAPVNSQTHSPLPFAALPPRPHRRSNSNTLLFSSPVGAQSTGDKQQQAGETPRTVRAASKETEGTVHGLSLTPQTTDRRMSLATATGLSPEWASEDGESTAHSLLLSARVASAPHSLSPRASGEETTPGTADGGITERRILFVDTTDDDSSSSRTRPSAQSALRDAEGTLSLAPTTSHVDVIALAPLVHSILSSNPLMVAQRAEEAPAATTPDRHLHALLMDPLSGELETSDLMNSLTGSTPAQFSATQRGATAPTRQDSTAATTEEGDSPGKEMWHMCSVSAWISPQTSGRSDMSGVAAASRASTASPYRAKMSSSTPGTRVTTALTHLSVPTQPDMQKHSHFAAAVFGTLPTGAAAAASVPSGIVLSLSAVSLSSAANPAARASPRFGPATDTSDVDSPLVRDKLPQSAPQLSASPIRSPEFDDSGATASTDRLASSPPDAAGGEGCPLLHDRILFEDTTGDLSAVEAEDNGASLRDVMCDEYDDMIDEQEPGDRFQMHHRFQFLHAFPASVCAASVFVPLTVDPTGVSWLALHRLDGMPYAVKEIADIHYHQLNVELECLTLGNDPVTTVARQAAAFITRYYTCTRTPAVPVREANGLHTSSAISASTNVYLLQTEYFPRGSAWEYALDTYRQARQHAAACLQSDEGTTGNARIKPFLFFKSQHWLHLARHTLKALEALHANELIHGNPVVHNVFVGDFGTFKLGNFGSAVKRPQRRYPVSTVPAALLPHYDGDVTPYEMDVGVFCNSVLALFMTMDQLQTRPATSEENSKYTLEQLAAVDLNDFDQWARSVTSLAYLDVPDRLLEGLLAARHRPFSATDFLARWVPAQTQEAYEACLLMNTELLRLALRREQLLAMTSPTNIADDEADRADVKDAAPPRGQSACEMYATTWQPDGHACRGSAPAAPCVNSGETRCTNSSTSSSRLFQDGSLSQERTPLMHTEDKKGSTHSLFALDASRDELRTPLHSASSPFLSPPTRLSGLTGAPVPWLQLPETTGRVPLSTAAPGRTGAGMPRMTCSQLGAAGLNNMNTSTRLSRRISRVVTINSPPVARPLSMTSASALEQTDRASSANSSRSHHRSLFRPAASLPSAGSAGGAVVDHEKARTTEHTSGPASNSSARPIVALPSSVWLWRSPLSGLSPRDAALGQAAAHAATFAADCLRRSLRCAYDESRVDANRSCAGAGGDTSVVSRRSSVVAVASRACEKSSSGRNDFPRDALLVNARATMRMMGWDVISDGSPRAAVHTSTSLTSSSGHCKRVQTIEEVRPLSSLE